MEVLQRTANRGSISDGGYDIDGSICWEDANDENMVKNYSGDGDRRTWTYSTWVKKLKFGSAQYDYMYMFGAAYSSILFLNNDLLRIALWNSGTGTIYADPIQVFRDASAWYHIIVTLDSTNATAADRVKIWINGVRVTSFSNSTYANMPQNTEFQIGQASNNYQVGYYYAGGGSNRGFSGYMAETHYVNGTALDETSFGEYDEDSGIWKPKEYTGSHGSKGFYLKFTDSSNIGKDSASSGIGDFTLSNITATDQATDTPTNLFATFNPLYLTVGTYPEGATKYTTNAYGGWKSVYPTMGAESGKWYAEFKHVDSSGSKFIGVVPFSLPGLPRGEAGYAYYGSTSNSIGYFNDGNRYINGGAASYGASWNNSDIMSIALDMDNGKVYFAKNGTWQNSGDPTSGATGTGAIDLIEPTQAHAFGPSLFDANTSMLCNYGGYTTISISSAASDANGHGTFEYAPPSGYFALCTKNLAEFG